MLQDKIRNLRKAKGWSQEELAIKLNVVRQTISKWETDETVPDIYQAKKLIGQMRGAKNILYLQHIKIK